MLTNAIRISCILRNPGLVKEKLQSINFGIFSTIIRVGLAAFLVFAIGNFTAEAQNVEVSGTVTDAEDGSPLPGVNIILKGTSTGTSTDADGFYSLRVPSGQDTLVASFVGYIPQEMPINGRNQIDIALSSDVQQLEDVVVVGYGSQDKRDATGSVVAVGEDDFNTGNITSPEQLLQGRAAGIQITPSSGEPGASANIRIRGTSSVRSDNGPLIVVDGVPLNNANVTPGGGDFGAGEQSARNPLSFINPDDIESISVLKDASASAIYGSRGSNGVVLITTKTGSSRPGGTLGISSNTSISSVREKINLLDAENYVDAAVAKGADPSTFESEVFSGSIDWQDEIYRTAVSQDYNLSYGGGTEQTTYRVSLGYTDQQGIVENSALERLTGRITANHAMLDDKLQLNLNLTNTRLEDSYAPVSRNAGFEGDLIGAALQANPLRPVFLDGELNQSSDFRNPVAMLNLIDDNAETTRLLANVSANYDFTDWLAYKVNLAYDNSESVRRTGIDPALQFNTTQDKGRAIIDNRYVQSTLVEHTLNAQQDFTEKINMNFLAGFSYQRFENRGDFLQSEFFVTDEVPFVDNVDGVDNSGDNKAFTAASDRSVEELQSYFGRANFNYDERYLATVNFRIDGSTKFGENNKYGYFPSFSGAWRISEEAFFNSSTITDLKLRAGYGITGNQEFPGGVSLAIFNVNNDGSITQANNPNPDIQWEETKQFSIGADIELLGGRINGSVDYFNKQTDNLIFRKDFAQPAAVDFQWVNLDGTVENTGVEFSVDAFVVDNNKFSWQVMYNMSFLNNEVTDLDTFVNTGEINGQGLSGAYAQRITEGQPLFSFYMREFAGYDENGFAQYANDGALSFQGDPLPDYNLGFTNNFNYARFDASIFLTGSFGFKVYNNTANAIFLAGNLRNGRNVTESVANGPESSLNFGEVSTRFLEDGDFIRLSNVSIGYNIDVSNLAPITRLRLSVTGQNLFVITDYSGYDPEVNTDKNINGVPSLGIDYTAYPRARTVTFGVKLDI